MTPSQLRARIIHEKATWIQQMLASVNTLPLKSYKDFHADPRNYPAAESFVRRALEALLDLGRHILAKGFGQAVAEYKEIARSLVDLKVLNESDGDLLRQLAGYRNRLVHYYDEISEQELYEICKNRLADIESLLEAFRGWIKKHPEMIDQAI
ncbi:MAG: DUF86 domain-containing protein [Deltaproteobacteria bacterium]|nr:DUF86 domain-containing protein [Deltaproteobacteria bacterium]